MCNGVTFYTKVLSDEDQVIMMIGLLWKKRRQNNRSMMPENLCDVHKI